MLFITLMTLNSCSGKKMQVEDTENNIYEYKSQLTDFAENYGYKLEVVEENYKDNLYTEYCMTISDTEKINISFSNMANTNTEKSGKEHFHVYYSIPPCDKKFNFELFTELTNIFSGKKINTKFCNNLLYKKRYRVNLQNYANIFEKRHYYSFLGEWHGYYVRYPEKEVFTFAGLTDAGTIHLKKAIRIMQISGVVFIILWLIIMKPLKNLTQKRMQFKNK